MELEIYIFQHELFKVLQHSCSTYRHNHNVAAVDLTIKYAIRPQKIRIYISS